MQNYFESALLNPSQPKAESGGGAGDEEEAAAEGGGGGTPTSAAAAATAVPRFLDAIAAPILFKVRYEQSKHRGSSRFELVKLVGYN